MQIEFENRVKMTVSTKEFDAINEVYMNSDLDKDEFCKMWVKMNAKRVAKSVEEKKMQETINQLKDDLFEVKCCLEHLDSESMSKPCDEVLTQKQTMFLNDAKIRLTEETRLPFFTGEGKGIIDYHILTTYRPIYSVIYEIEKFLKVA